MITLPALDMTPMTPLPTVASPSMSGMALLFHSLDNTWACGSTERVTPQKLIPLGTSGKKPPMPDGTTRTFPVLGTLTKRGNWWHKADGGAYGDHWTRTHFGRHLEEA